MELKVPRGDEKASYVLRAEGHREHALSVDLSEDRLLRATLERQAPPVADKDKQRPKPPARPAKPRRPAVHDADGLAVPSF